MVHYIKCKFCKKAILCSCKSTKNSYQLIITIIHDLNIFLKNGECAGNHKFLISFVKLMKKTLSFYLKMRKTCFSQIKENNSQLFKWYFICVRKFSENLILQIQIPVENCCEMTIKRNPALNMFNKFRQINEYISQ